MTTSSQRWRDRVARFRPAGEAFDPGRAAVAEIDERTAKDFVTRHHYSGTYPAARLRVGMRWKRSATSSDELAGVVVFSVPMNVATIPHYFGLQLEHGVELGRLILLDDVPANAESWFVARAFRILRARLGARAVVSYSDPVERIANDGTIVKPGHIGIVYQALNAAYRGRSSSKTMLLAGDGRCVSERAICKLRADHKGAAYAYAQLRGMGAPARHPFEDGPSYVRRALANFTRVHHPGNHVYCWRFDGAPNARLPYPKPETLLL